MAWSLELIGTTALNLIDSSVEENKVAKFVMKLDKMLEEEMAQETMIGHKLSTVMLKKITLREGTTVKIVTTVVLMVAKAKTAKGPTETGMKEKTIINRGQRHMIVRTDILTVAKRRDCLEWMIIKILTMQTKMLLQTSSKMVVL